MAVAGNIAPLCKARREGTGGYEARIWRRGLEFPPLPVVRRPFFAAQDFVLIFIFKQNTTIGSLC